MEWNTLKSEFETESHKVIEWINNEYGRIRSGRVSLTILDVVRPHIYGESLPLNQVANIQIVDSRQFLIKPYDRSQLQEIAKAITASPLGVTPQISTDSIRLVFPTQTEENRKLNVKKAKETLEVAKTKLRGVRKHVQDIYKKQSDTVSEDLIHFFEDELNKITKIYNDKLESLFYTKEIELMKV